ncbi:MAG: LamG-like jellyroll fold domain-containing protein, partial [Verrucomicrobiota bacterium]
MLQKQLCKLITKVANMKINPRLFLFLLASGSCCFQLQATLTEYQTAVKNEASLIAYYTFDAGNANDSKATYHGTAAGTVAYDTGVGLGTDKALILSGAGHINLGEVEPFNFASGSGTIEAWIRADWTTSPGYNPAIFADRDDAPVNWSLHMNSGKDGIGLWNGSTYQPLTIGSGGARTAWHHFAAVFELNPSTGEPTFTEYWDGNPLGTTPQGLGAAPESPTELGSSSAAGTERWRGGLDEVAFYSQALSADAIKAHYTAFLVGEKPTILTAPAGGNFLAGIPLTLSVSAKGAQLSYQWLKNGAALTAATNATLTFPQLSAGDAGSYTVTVSNPAGQVTSTGAIVAIGTLPAKLTQYQAAVRAEPSLISYYTFDQVNANDSKAANHGTVQGTVQFLEGVGGGAGKALVMDGSGHINLGQVDALDFATGTGTIEAWVRADWTGGVGYNGAIFADRDGGPVNWSIHMNDAKDG